MRFMLIALIMVYSVTCAVSDNKAGNTPLHRSAFCGNYKRVKLLLNNGADPEAVNHYKETPLHCAVRSGSLDKVDALIAVSNNLDTQDRNGATALLVSLACKERRVALKLLNSGARMDIESHNGLRPFLYPSDDQGRLKWGTKDISGFEISSKSAHTTKTKKGERQESLHEAASRGNIDAIMALMPTSISIPTSDLNEQNEQGDTALALALKSGHLETALLLLNAGTRLNTQNNDGFGPRLCSASKKKKKYRLHFVDTKKPEQHEQDNNA